MQEIKVSRVYRHFKGDYYVVEALAHDSETQEPCVIYRKLYEMAGSGCGRLRCSPQRSTAKNTPTRSRNIDSSFRKYKAPPDIER